MSATKSLTVASASVPDQITQEVYVWTYDSTSSMTIAWNDTQFNGGFEVLSYKLYKDNVLYQEVDSTYDRITVSGLVLGVSYKFQVSSTNEIGESQLSPSRRIVFANRPDPISTLTLSANSEPKIFVNWGTSSNTNGEVPFNYLVYIDNGLGSNWTVVYNGTGESFSANITSQIECSMLYNIRVTAINSAGESDPIERSIKVG